MGRTRKSIAILKAEGRTHLTKKQIAQRELAERSWRTGTPIQTAPEIENDPIAKAQFERVTMLLERLGANDEVFGACTRRYCMNTSYLQETKRELAHWEELRDSTDSTKLYKEYDKLARHAWRLTRTLERELLQYEKDQGMTVISSMKLYAPKTETKPDPLQEILGY